MKQTNVLELIETDNQLLGKVVRVMAWICDEARTLKKCAQNKFYSQLLMFGEEVSSNEVFIVFFLSLFLLSVYFFLFYEYF